MKTNDHDPKRERPQRYFGRWRKRTVVNPTAVCRQVKIVSPQGLHARAAYALARLVARFDANIRLHYRDVNVPAHSLSALLLLGAATGDQVLVVANGSEAVEAVDLIDRFFAAGFEVEDDD